MKRLDSELADAGFDRHPADFVPEPVSGGCSYSVRAGDRGLVEGGLDPWMDGIRGG